MDKQVNQKVYSRLSHIMMTVASIDAQPEEWEGTTGTKRIVSDLEDLLAFVKGYLKVQKQEGC